MSVVAQDPSALPAYSVGDPAILAFTVLPLILVAGFVWGVTTAWRRSGARAAESRRVAIVAGCSAAAWMALTDFAARSGILRHWDWTPPPFLVLALAIVTLGVAIASGPIGRRFAVLPLSWLVASQSFRLPLELAMHEWDRLKANDSLECRNCHDYTSMDLTRQGSRAAQTHKLWLGTGRKTCIDCHKGVAHHLPDMTGVPQG